LKCGNLVGKSRVSGLDALRNLPSKITTRMQSLRRIFLLIIGLSLAHLVAAQDTTIVQTLRFEDGIDNLRGWYQFPPKSKSFSKVLAFMTLKCDKDLIPNPTNSGCGEWDAGADLKVHFHTGEYDSVKHELGRYLINGSNPASFKYAKGPLYNYHRSYQKSRKLTKVNSIDSFTIDSGNNNGYTSPHKFSTNIMMWQASELKSLGLQKGLIHQLALDKRSYRNVPVGLKISYKTTTDQKLSSNSLSGFDEVYAANHVFGGARFTPITLTRPIEWDGTSSLVIAYEFENIDKAFSHNFSKVSFDASVVSKSNDGYLDLSAREYVLSSMQGYKFDDEITVSFWAMGDADSLPEQSTIFSFSDAFDRNVASGHLGWNQNARWDSGSDGKIDRCQREANASDLTGTWNHWTFTKNVATGITRIYLNGKVFYQEASDKVAIGEVNRLVVGNYIGYELNRTYFGKIDEFRVWSKELDQQTIQDWMYMDVQDHHPERQALVLYYKFDEEGQVLDHSGNNYNGLATHAHTLKTFSTTDQFRNVQYSGIRPNIRFYQGDFESVLDSVLVLDSSLVKSKSLIEYGTEGRKFVIKNIGNVWAPQETYVFDSDGNIVETVVHGLEGTLLADTVSYFEEPFEITDQWTIAKYITPYGNYLDLGDGFTWVWDITEFEQFFRDSVDLEAGSKREIIDLKFMMVEGPPAADISISRIWHGESSKYFELSEDLTKAPVDVDVNEDTRHLFLRSSLGGHKHASSNGEYPHCCEWKNNEHYMYANGQLVDTWHVWKNCGTTALFPQGGTWPGAREGWCPGDVRDLHYTRLTDYIRNDNTINLDYRITPVPQDNPGMGNGGYSNGGWYFMQYGEPTFKTDAEVLRVLAPSNWDIYKRINPICTEARVVIRNNGDEPLTKLTVSYGVKGGENRTYDWTGNLLFKDVDTLLLPVDNGDFYVGDGSNAFVVSTSKPNGKDDEYVANDSYTSYYDLPDMYNHRIKIDFKTNNVPGQNSYYVTNALGNKIFERTSMEANTRYQDELNTFGGCYTLHVEDAGNDGLEYWANPAQGNGYVFIRRADNNKLIKTFDSDFGSGIEYAFSIGGMSYIKEPNTEGVMQVYPNPANDIIQVEMGGATAGSTIHLLNSVGQVVYTKTLRKDELKLSIPVSDFETGVYVLNWINGTDQFSERVILSR